ncbi:MAG: CehA/McbA family metallohydrolase [Chitinispirillaceae bacterium]|nr:CehA/McbA family metallohydrolase [Chitinispirillaceae bacterium]
MPILNRNHIVLVLLQFTLSCTYRDNPVHPRNNPFDPGGVNWVHHDSATIFDIDETNGTEGVIVNVFTFGSTDTVPVLADTTDSQGVFSIKPLPIGTYTLLARKDSFLLFMDSLVIDERYTTLHDDTLERPSSLSGTLSGAFFRNTSTVTLSLPGTGKLPIVVDSSGEFTLSGLSSGNWRLCIDNGSAETPAVRMSVIIPRSTDVQIADTIRPGYTTLPPSIGGYHVFYGFLHNHSNFSDGIGTPSEAYRYARNRAGLDFFSLADHCFAFNADNWSELKSIADSCNEDYLFTAFWGFEWSGGKSRHYTVTATDDYCSAMDTATATLPALCNWLSDRDGVAFINHPNYYTADDIFNRYPGLLPPDNIVGMELWNKLDGFNYYYYDEGYFPQDNHKGYYDEVLSAGWKIGAAGSDDNHHGTWGTRSDYRMAVLARCRTREDILQALRNRRFYSTLDKNLCLSFTVDGREMGSTVAGYEHTFKVEAFDGNREQFTNVIIFDKNHDMVLDEQLNTPVVALSREYTFEEDGYFYVKITQQDGDEAISSPIWIEN